MELTVLTLLWLALILIGGYGIYKVFTLKEEKVAGVRKGFTYIPLLALLFIGLLQLNALSWITPALEPLAAAGEVIPEEPGVTPSVTPPVTPPVTPIVGAKQKQISTFNVQLKEKHSNAYDQVGNGSDGFLKIYDPAVNPSDPTANPIVSINVTSGTAEKTAPNLKTDTNYRVVFDGSNEWYTKDYGIITFPYSEFNENTGVYLFDKDSIARMATIDDTLDETTTSGDINGQTTDSQDNELFNTTTADTLYYNKTTGDGVWYIKPEISISGGNREIQKLVWCYTWDVDNPPEGNEISSIAYQHESGTAFAAMPSEQVTLWSTQSCVQLAPTVMGGTVSKFRITVTQDDTEIDSNDDWAMRVDDLGDFQGKDVVLNTGRAYDSIKIDAVT